ncbi:MAG: hypothetical protein JNL38_16150 [Myxococcales bacterium]|jgi:hypothetical protein|nr:hypothetical protein [Myxococcales bacterium]
MAAKRKRIDTEGTAAPVRNFTIPLAERIRALGGPPAYVVRKKRIEDLTDKLVLRVVEALDVSDARAEALAEVLDLAPLNKLIDTHNRYYPAEANLPLSPVTGEMLERGEPWRPMAPMTPESLLALAREARGD